jgi:hypothetical protein
MPRFFNDKAAKRQRRIETKYIEDKLNKEFDAKYLLAMKSPEFDPIADLLDDVKLDPKVKKEEESDAHTAAFLEKYHAVFEREKNNPKWSEEEIEILEKWFDAEKINLQNKKLTRVPALRG